MVDVVRSGRAVLFSRPFPKVPAPNNPTPAQHFMNVNPRGSGASAVDYYGISYHGTASTHLDSLCHVWDQNGMWNGRNPTEQIGFDGAHWGAITNWNTGIITRGVLLDVPRFRGSPFVRFDAPIHGWELAEVAKAEGVMLEPRDAVCVYGGREAWDRALLKRIWKSKGCGLSPQGYSPWTSLNKRRQLRCAMRPEPKTWFICHGLTPHASGVQGFNPGPWGERPQPFDCQI